MRKTGGSSSMFLAAFQVKADYAPFLVRCVKSPEKLRSFFDRLFFGTVQESLQSKEHSQHWQHSPCRKPAKSSSWTSRPGPVPCISLQDRMRWMPLSH